MNIKNYKFYLVVLALFTFASANASHMMGSDVSYVCISPGKYKVIAKVYRDCRGIPLNSPTINVFCDNGSASLNYTRTAINDISPTCVGGTAPCNPQNTTSAEGIEEHVFEGIVDFSVAPFKALKDAGCCKIYFSVEQCCRNGAITTITPGNLYTEAMLDICNVGKGCNTSPQLSIPPVAYLCCNQPFTYNNGVREVIDGDSLAYDLANPLNGNNSNESFVSPFTKSIPLTPYCPPNPGTVNCKPLPNAKPPRGFYFDKETGDIVFTPTNCDEVGVLVIEINEYRKDSATKKWKLIGTTRRDMQLVVKQCPDNNPPKILGSNKYTVCEGNKICFQIDSKDEPFLPNQTVPDTTYMDWNNGILGATFRIIDPTAREKSAEFCWQTKIGDARPNAYSFTVTAKDNNCPRPAQANKGFNVVVKFKARSIRKYDILECGKLRFQAFPMDTFNAPASSYKYQFTIRDSTNSGLPLYNGFKQKDSIKFKRGGKYLITHQVNNGFNCPTIYVDTVIMPPVLDVELAFGKDTFVCAGDSLTLTPIVANGVPSYKYKWEVPIGTKNPKDTLDHVGIRPTFTTQIVLILTDKNKCVDTDTIKIKYQPLPVVNIGPDRRICTYQSIVLDAQNDDTLRYYWQPDGDSTRTKEVNIAGKYIAKVIDHLGCNTSDTMELFVNDTVVAIAKPDREICIQDTLRVKANRRPKGYTRQFVWTDLNTNTVMAYDSFLNTKITQQADRKYDLYLRVTQSGVTCEDRDTMNLKVNPLPKLSAIILPPRCFADGKVLLNMVTANGGNTDKIRYWHRQGWVTGGPAGTNWYYYDYPSFITNDKVPKTGLRDTIWYSFRDSNGCYNQNRNQVRLNPNPTVVTKNGIFCQKAGLIDLTKLIVAPIASVRSGGISKFRVLEVPASSGVDPTFIVNEDVSVIPAKWTLDPGQEGENHKTGDYIVEYCFKDGLTSCQTCDTSTVKVIRLPEIEFDQIPSQCVNYPLLALDSFVKERNTQARFPDGMWSAVEYGGSRDLATVGATLSSCVVNQKQFNPSLQPSKPGIYMLKFLDTASGCPVTDSLELTVNGLPQIIINVPDTVCSSAGLTALTSNYPGNPNAKWTGPFVTGETFDPSQSPKTQQYEGPYKLVFAYTNPNTKCTNKDSQNIKVQSQPEVLVTTPKPYQQCENKVFNMTASKQWATATTWTSTGDGVIANTKQLNTTYTHGTQDTMNSSAVLSISTDKEGVCPPATDNVTLLIEPYPQYVFSGDPLQQCEPATVNFESQVRKPQNPANLRYSWWYGNGDSTYMSALSSPQNIRYDTSNRKGYDVRIMVSNKWGSADSQTCNVTVDSIGYIKVWPMPKAAFTSDPGFFTTVAFPKFKFINQSTVKFGNLSYLWNFDSNDPDDTSTQVNPIKQYVADTLKYWVNLQAMYNYRYNGEDLVCMDSTGYRREVRPDVTVFVPTAFSPEGTGPKTNNKFRAVVNGEKSFEIVLFNRWGEILWQTQDKNEGWDGRYRDADCQQDVYAWLITVTAYDGKEYQYEGTVTLLR